MLFNLEVRNPLVISGNSFEKHITGTVYWCYSNSQMHKVIEMVEKFNLAYINSYLYSISATLVEMTA